MARTKTAPKVETRSTKHHLTVRVHYPDGAGHLVLRTDVDWDKNLAPTRVTGDGTCHTFDIESDRPYIYFKPCLITREGFFWAKGGNVLGLCEVREGKDVWPHFFEDSGGLISPDFEMGSLMPRIPSHHIRIYHPPGYFENTLKRYPVLYMHDGQNLFFPEEAFLGSDWRVGRTMELLDAMSIIEKTIVVGIYPQNRMAEYTKPGYETYGKFLVELKHSVDNMLRTSRGPETTGVMGSSLGGVVSFYLAWQYPQLFGMGACMSSTFTYQDDLMQRVESEPKRHIKLYLDSGWPGDNYEVTRSMRDLLLRRGFRYGQDLLYFAFPEARHNETFWATRSHIPFQWFFGEDPYPKLETGNIIL